MVKWEARLSNGEKVTGKCGDGSWPKIELGENRISEVKIFNDRKEATIDKNKSGYFIGIKAIALVQGGTRANFVGIGYLDDDTVRIKWYRMETLELWTTEARSVEKAGFLLVKNE